MSPNWKCPSCGAPLEDNVGRSCPFCGAALNPASAPTIISAPVKKQRAAANSSAEAMDEVKKLVREGDTAGAAEVASEEFSLDMEAAESTVEQVGFDMRYSAPKPVIVEPAPASRPSKPLINSSPFDEPKKPSNSRPGMIGWSVGAVVFLGLCCCLPLLITIVMMVRNR